MVQKETNLRRRWWSDAKQPREQPVKQHKDARIVRQTARRLNTGLKMMFRVLTPASPPPFKVYNFTCIVSRFGCELLLLVGTAVLSRLGHVHTTRHFCYHMRRWSGPTCRRPGPGGTRAGAAVVAIGVTASEAQLHVSAHMGEEAGSAGRSRRSLRTPTRRRGRRRCRGESVEV